MAGYDPADSVTAAGLGHRPFEGYLAKLNPDGLAGAWISVARQFVGLRNEASAPALVAETVTSVFEDAVVYPETARATIVDPVEVVDPARLSSASVIRYEFQRDFDRYLGELGEATPQDSLADVVTTGQVIEPVASAIESGDP